MERQRCVGTVTAFDVEVGLGEVATPDGARYPFHCTEVVDGSRDVPTGAVVEFVLVPGRPKGRTEAYEITPVG